MIFICFLFHRSKEGTDPPCLPKQFTNQLNEENQGHRKENTEFSENPSPERNNFKAYQKMRELDGFTKNYIL